MSSAVNADLKLKKELWAGRQDSGSDWHLKSGRKPKMVSSNCGKNWTVGYSSRSFYSSRVGFRVKQTAGPRLHAWHAFILRVGFYMKKEI